MKEIKFEVRYKTYKSAFDPYMDEGYGYMEIFAKNAKEAKEKVNRIPCREALSATKLYKVEYSDSKTWYDLENIKEEEIPANSKEKARRYAEMLGYKVFEVNLITRII